MLFLVSFLMLSLPAPHKHGRFSHELGLNYVAYEPEMSSSVCLQWYNEDQNDTLPTTPTVGTGGATAGGSTQSGARSSCMDIKPTH